MQLIRLVVVLVAGVAAAAGYVVEGRRLQTIRQLSGEEARAFYEAGRTRDERALVLFAVALAIAAAVALLKDVVFVPLPPAGASLH